jgi:outer membrane protein with beta-barrel domain
MTMFRNALLAVAFVVAASAGAQAQDHRVEIAGTAGWTFSDGVSGNPVLVPGVGTFDRLDPKDAFSWGARIGFLVNEHVEVGGLFNLQSTTLEVSGTNTLEIGDQKIYNYHGFIAYNFGDPDAKTRPYFLGGAGATQYGGLTTSIGNRDIGGNTQFSTTWALGVKMYPGNSVGIMLEGRWTPTYIKSDSEGWWCDPYWGCYVVGNAQYSNQWELAGGITLRF